MNYLQIRQMAVGGDVFCVRGNSFISKITRRVTGSSFSHVGFFVWIENGLWCAEMMGYGGYTLSPASQRIREILDSGDGVDFVEAPACVRDLDNTDEILKFRGTKYSHLKLITVGLSNWLGIRVSTSSNVCSTIVRRLWESKGVRFEKTAAPDDIYEKGKNPQRVTLS